MHHVHCVLRAARVQAFPAQTRHQGAGRREPPLYKAALWRGVRHSHRPQVGIPTGEVSSDAFVDISSLHELESNLPLGHLSNITTSRL